jgi:hypothetical protein
MSNKRKVRHFTERLRQAGQAQDSAFFENNPTATVYERPATALELKATGYPPGTMVRVQRVGAQRIRAFVVPDTRGN